MISPANLRQKHSKEANYILLHAFCNRMEQVVLLMLERGFPSDFNAPILKQDDSSNNGKKGKSFQYPSYFLFAVATGMYNVVAYMIKRSNVNQSWYGLTALMLTCSRRAYDDNRTVALLLDYGADPEHGILLPQLCLMSKLDRYAFRVPQPWSDDGSGEQSLRQRRLPQRGRSTNASTLSSDTTTTSISHKERILTMAKDSNSHDYILPFELAAARGNQQSMQSILKRYVNRV
ncbi:hypothetical protein BDF19DRAFT_259819 [Syncephalis fuscata]|nr:hypothetical protein BDF19DRAFT_259819 [Syncephalis fuscata]